MMAKKCRVSFEDDENVLKLIIEMEEKLCENTKVTNYTTINE